jgi:hypothetical protein
MVADRPDDVVAIAVAAGRLALLDPTAQAAPRLVRQVPQIERTHGTLEPDVQLVHLAFSKRHDPHAQEPHALVDVGAVLLITRDAIKRFGHDVAKPARGGVLQELLDTKPDQARAGDRLVDVAVRHEPAFPRCILLAHAQLVGDRGLSLQVRRVAGIKGDGR